MSASGSDATKEEEEKRENTTRGRSKEIRLERGRYEDEEAIVDSPLLGTVRSAPLRRGVFKLLPFFSSLAFCARRVVSKCRLIIVFLGARSVVCRFLGIVISVRFSVFF